MTSPLNFMMDILNHKNLVIYITILFIFWFLYFLIARTISSSKLEIDQKRRGISKARTIFLILAVLFSIILWANEIYSIIISVTALVAALAIATKELVLCIGGLIYKTSTGAFSIGDRVEVNGVRGDILDFGFLGTTILEVGPGNLTHQYTGRSVTIPNALFLTQNIINESYSTDFVLHTFEVLVEFDKNWENHRDTLFNCAQTICSPYIVQAKSHFKKLSQKKQMESPAIEPRVTLKIKSPDEIALIARITVPAKMRGSIEQKILNSYLSEITKVYKS